MAALRPLQIATAALGLLLAACTTTSSSGVSAPKAGTGIGQASPFLNANLVDVACASTQQCAAVGINFDGAAASAPLTSSTDGGLGWSLDTSAAPAGTKLTSVACGPVGCLSIGRSLAGSLVYRLDPEASSWTAATRPSKDAVAEAVACAAKRFCAVVFHDSTHHFVSTTLNGGSTWSEGGTLPPTAGAVFQLSCDDAFHCLAGGIDAQGSGAVTVTTDGGATWAASNLGTTPANRIWDVACQSHKNCAIVADLSGATTTTILTSQDGGVTFAPPATPWTQVTTPRALSCTAASCVVVGADANGHGAAAVFGSNGLGKLLALTYAPTPLLSVGCSSASRCVGAGLGSLVVLSPSVPKGSQQQGGQFRQ